MSFPAFSDFDTLIIVVAFFVILIVWARYAKWGLSDLTSHDIANGAWHQLAEHIGLEYEKWGYIGTYWGYEVRLYKILMSEKEEKTWFGPDYDTRSLSDTFKPSIPLQKIELRNIRNASNGSLFATPYENNAVGLSSYLKGKQGGFYCECKPASLAEALDMNSLRQRLKRFTKAFEWEVRLSDETLYRKSFFIRREKDLHEMIDLLCEIARSIEAVSI